MLYRFGDSTACQRLTRLSMNKVYFGRSCTFRITSVHLFYWQEVRGDSLDLLSNTDAAVIVVYLLSKYLVLREPLLHETNNSSQFTPSLVIHSDQQSFFSHCTIEYHEKTCAMYVDVIYITLQLCPFFFFVTNKRLPSSCEWSTLSRVVRVHIEMNPCDRCKRIYRYL